MSNMRQHCKVLPQIKVLLPMKAIFNVVEERGEDIGLFLTNLLTFNHYCTLSLYLFLEIHLLKSLPQYWPVRHLQLWGVLPLNSSFGKSK